MNQDYQKISELYGKGYTLSQIGIETGYTRQWVRQILRKTGTRDVRSEDIHNHETINTNYFHCIDTEEKAYFLGLMYADGNVYIGQNGKRKHYTVSLQLQEQDLPIIERLRDAIAPNHKLYYKLFKTGSNQWKLAFDSKIVAEQLIALGCTPKKSLTLTFPTKEQVPENQVRHFVRGYMDGDGCISDTNTSGFSVSFVSTNDFCKSLSAITDLHLGRKGSLYIRPLSKKGNGITTELAYGGNKQAGQILNWLYENSAVYLNRKFMKYQKLVKLREVIC